MTTAKQTARKTKEVATTAKPVEKKKPTPKKVVMEQTIVPPFSGGVTVSANTSTLNKIPVTAISGLDEFLETDFVQIDAEFDNVYAILKYVATNVAESKYRKFYKEMQYFGCSDNEIKRLWAKTVNEL